MSRSRPLRSAPPADSYRSHAGARFDRGAWLTLAFVLGFGLLCVGLGVASLSRIGDGCQLVGDELDPPRPIEACFGRWPTPLRPGDRVVAVEGIVLSGIDGAALVAQPLPGGWADGGTVSYAVLRDGAPLTLAVPLGRLSMADILRVLGAALTRQLYDFMLPIFVGSLIIFLLAPGAAAARLMLIASGPLFAMTTFVWGSETVGSHLTGGPVGILTVAIESLWGWLFVPTLLLLVLSFPRRVWPLSRWPRRTAALVYGVPVVAFLVFLVTGRFEPYVAVLGLSALAVIGCAAAIALHTLLRGKDPVLRAQTTWMALGIGIGFAFLPLFWTMITLVPGAGDGLNRLPAWSDALLNVVVGMAFPLSMGIAITRYRLFDIDVIIRRTLVYGVLTAMLAAIYVGSVVVLQRIVQPITGTAQSELVTVVSTLAIAALFQPLRQRIQQGIDRRFYRRKYNAQRTLHAFGARLRNETDVDRLTDDMLTVVEQTLQPSHTSLWLRETDQNRGPSAAGGAQ